MRFPPSAPPPGEPGPLLGRPLSPIAEGLDSAVRVYARPMPLRRSGKAILSWRHLHKFSDAHIKCNLGSRLLLQGFNSLY